MIPCKTVIRPVNVTFTNCELRTDVTANIIRKRTTKADERYNIEVTGRAKRFQQTRKAYVARSRVVIG